jgi:hypothetical protein
MKHFVPIKVSFFFILVHLMLFSACSKEEKVLESIPLPEHPRPDFERAEWLNLNGYWDFEFDTTDVGEAEKWAEGERPFAKKILVPFPWGSPLSEVENEGDIAWYKRQITIPDEWQGKRVFLVVGASDWLTKGWIDGNPVGEYQGGYTPFEFELTDHARFGQSQDLVMRVDDSPHDFKLFGKQGYGNAKGIWQTVYLEARPMNYIEHFYFTPDIDTEKLHVRVVLNQAAENPSKIRLNFVDETSNYAIGETDINAGEADVQFEVDIAEPVLWTLENPHLYDVELVLDNDAPDVISSYFGMRKISIEKLPGTDVPYVALNNEPIYLQTTLDQAYHPEGFYTFPTDAFIRDEIWRSKEIGLNGQRVHIKVPIPRKLYWADRLGLLIMADVPNSWGEPDEKMQQETRVALEGMIARDYNHPSIFSWVLFNETWGLFSRNEDGKRTYKKETQDWVEEMYYHTKELDSTRLVEDNSACNYDHVVTDMNTWHAYLPGYAWKDFLQNAVEQTYPGSPWNFTEGNVQDDVPMFNSECGNVWGYEGSTGDIDWSWDYHIMINEFRRHPEVAGWLYTEHHDVINEWNGYWKYDRSRKFTGLEELVEGMELNDLHSYIYLAPGVDLCQDIRTGQTVQIPVRLSVMTDDVPGEEVTLLRKLYGWNSSGEMIEVSNDESKLLLQPWVQKDLDELEVVMPSWPGLLICSMQLTDANGELMHSNFTTFNVKGGENHGDRITFQPNDFTDQQWSLKQWNILDGLKVNGAGHGFFEYEVNIPEAMDLSNYQNATFIAELSSKPLHGKDQDKERTANSDYMRGQGLHDPSENPNSYPMTDEYQNPSQVEMTVNGSSIGTLTLEDDPADHRGILSWHAQLRDRKLREAGTFGYLVELAIDKPIIEKAIQDGKFTIRLEVDESSDGGLAVYGRDFGRYPLDPTILFE